MSVIPAVGPTGRIVLPPARLHPSLLLAQQAHQRPDRPFLTIEGRTQSYHAMHEQVMRTAAGLAGLGVGEGSRVGVLLPNRAAFVALWFATAHLGAAIVAINPQFRGRLLDTAVGDTDCSVVVPHAASADALASVAVPIRARIGAVVGADVATAGRDGAASLPAWLQAPAAQAPAAKGDLRSVQVVSFTTGSTGPAKGVLITTKRALDAACTYVHATRLAADDTLYTPFAYSRAWCRRTLTCANVRRWPTRLRSAKTTCASSSLRQGVALDTGALYDWLSGVMPKYMLPRYIEFVASLPRTATNKVEKFQLKDAGLGAGAWDRELHRPAARAAAKVAA